MFEHTFYALKNMNNVNLLIMDDADSHSHLLSEIKIILNIMWSFETNYSEVATSVI